jgi:hypothetical protein
LHFKMVSFPSLVKRIREFFSNISCENLVSLSEVKLTKVCFPPPLSPL